MIDKKFLLPMQPFPGLEKYSKKIKLPKSGINLFYYEAGEEEHPVIMLIHGLGDEADTWRHIIEPLSSQHRVIAPDLPGFGRSDKPKRDYSLTFTTQALLELIEILEIQQPIWIGNSLGAILSQAIALQSPQHVRSLVLIDGSMLQGDHQKINLTQLLFLLPGVGRWIYNRLRKDPRAAYESLRPYYHNLDALPEEDKEFLYERANQRVWDDQQREAYLSSLRNLVFYLIRQQKKLKDTIPNMEIPTLILWGEEDKIINYKNGYFINNILPISKLVVIPETGHLVQQENPENLLKSILMYDEIIIEE
jgi:pimeloyl-ACP methyl ester carboxylesterase